MTNFSVDPASGYLTFNGLTFTQLINDALRNSGVFTDQDFQGSNLTAIHQTIGYVVSVLMLYLNQTSSENMFTDSQQLINMNRIVKQLGYNPIGYQTSTIAFDLQATAALPIGLYTIPRYSWVDVNGLRMSLAEDVTFAKTIAGVQSLDSESATYLMYQGQVIEHPNMVAVGTPNELMFLSVDDQTQVDHFSIDVYVKSISTGMWSQWQQTESLFLSQSNDEAYELRYNHNGRYEISFGDNINGQQLTAGDIVAVYYIASNGTSGEVAIGALNGKPIIAFDTIKMREITADTSTGINPPILSTAQLSTGLVVSNDSTSTSSSLPESVTSIRKNAPGTFARQHRLVTTSDYKGFLSQTFANLIKDVEVINNDEYLDTYMKYLWDLGIQQPHLTSRALFSQANFGTSNNFNNVYAFVVSKSSTGIGVPTYLPAAFKNLMIKAAKPLQMATARLIPIDPIMMAFGPGALHDFVITPDANSVRSATSIQNEVADVIRTTFEAYGLGATINAAQLTADIYNIDGVGTVGTRNLITNQIVSGISLVGVVPTIGLSEDTITSVRQLPSFIYPYWEAEDIVSQVTVLTSTTPSFAYGT